MNAIRRAATLGTAIALGAVMLTAGPAFAEGTNPAPAPAPAASAVTLSEAASALSRGTTHAQNPSVPEGTAWTEHYFPSPVASSNGDAVTLHADVLRPEGLALDARTPVIMSVGPYFSHSGMNEDTHPEHTGPSARFTDLIVGAGLPAKGYTFVYVDLRGFGGSTGCIDWQGPGEQGDVVAAVEWAASQPWSTGAVGLYGKSYDASTGLVGIDRQPEGLEAVVAQEPSWSAYDYLVTNDVPRPQQILSPQSYLGIANLPGVDRAYQQDGYDIAPDTDTYLTAAAYEKTHPECAETVLAGTKATDRSGEFWSIRDFPANVNGSTVPLLFTQGLTEQNTKPESMQEFLTNHGGEQRGWLGPWDHVRGNEKDAEGRLQMGRAGWFDEVMDFYDRHLVQHSDSILSRFFVQDNFGHWRVQDAWGTTPKSVAIELRPGSYLDTGRGTVVDDEPDPTNPNPLVQTAALAAGDSPGAPGTRADGADAGGGIDDAPATNDQKLGVITESQALRTDVRLTGTPSIELRTEGTGNVAVQLWDVAPDRTAVTINQNVAKLSTDGATRFTLLGMDWTLLAGHTLAVSYDTIDWGYWSPTPSNAEVVVTRATLDVDVEPTATDVPTEGDRAPFLDEYIKRFTWDDPLPVTAPSFTLSASTGSIGTSAASVVAGGTVEIVGAGYDPGAPVGLSWVAGEVDGAVADAQGAFRASVTVPAGLEPGILTLTATAEDGSVSSLDLEVTAAVVPTPTATPAPAPTTTPAPAPGEPGAGSGGSLAATGAPFGAFGAGASVAVLASLLGAALVLLRRRAPRS
ncbi:CocE/NonD family hydrolase [Herbiconiux sp. A18JL235]|uniref:CocE/NonD family hydrolase n=1 Tax=Herbiconiux sp. A18JL235 TaxID=3152363 RepID=A0AB39BJQ0_9MICO